MKSGLRQVASRILTAASRLLPRRLEPWVRAMERELDDIGDDRTAFRFAAGCLRAVLGLTIAALLASTLGAARRSLSSHSPSSGSLIAMNAVWNRPRTLALLCGGFAAGVGMGYLLAAGAPSLYLLVNLAALVLGAAAWLALGRTAGSDLAGAGPVVLGFGVLLLLTAFFGVAVDGASRWVSLGSLTLQVSLILLPVMLVLYARRPDPIGTAGMIAAALALAAQPDRAMAAVQVAGLLGLMCAAPGRLPLVATSASIAAFCWTLLTPDALPAVPFVDRILYTAFDVHPLAGLGVAIGAAALAVPTLVVAWRSAGERAALLAFGTCWAGMVVAAALGDYPTPVVGYGGSAILGYLLSGALLPIRALGTGGAQAPVTRDMAGPSSDHTVSKLNAPHFA